MASDQLISDGFSGLMKDDTAFLCRVCLLAVDEALGELPFAMFTIKLAGFVHVYEMLFSLVLSQHIKAQDWVD